MATVFETSKRELMESREVDLENVIPSDIRNGVRPTEEEFLYLAGRCGRLRRGYREWR